MSILKVESIREPYNNTEAMFIDSSGDVTFSGSVVIPGTISGVNLSTLNTTVSTLATDLTSLNSTVSTLSTDLTSLNSTVGNIVGLPDAIDVDVSAPADSVNIDSSGNLFVGTTSIGGVGSPKAVIKQSTTNWYEGLVISASSNDNILTLGHTGTEAQIGASYGTSGSYTPLTFKTSNTERMRIDSSGNVGIGRTSITYKLEVNGDIMCGQNGNTLRFGRVGQSDGAQIQCDNSSNLIFRNYGGNERMRIDSSGRVTMPYQPSFLAVKSNGNQGTTSAVLFNTVAHNIGGHYSTSTGRFTAPVDGYYFLTFSAHGENSQPIRLNMQKNGTTMIGGTRYSNGASHGAVTIANIQYLSANDYVSVNIDAGTVWGGDTASGPQFSGRLVG